MVDEPLATILTPISLDHCSFLGDTIEAIAGEKAGILKRGRPAIVSRQCERALGAIEARASALSSPLHIGGQTWDVFEQHGRLVFQDEDCLLNCLCPAFSGAIDSGMRERPSRPQDRSKTFTFPRRRLQKASRRLCGPRGLAAVARAPP